MDNLILIHLVDGTEVITGVHGRIDGQLGLNDPYRVVFRSGMNEQKEQVISWEITPLHPLQNLVRGANFMPHIQASNVLFTIPREHLPSGLITDYQGAVATERATVQQILDRLASQQEQQEPLADIVNAVNTNPVGEEIVKYEAAEADDGSEETRA